MPPASMMASVGFFSVSVPEMYANNGLRGCGGPKLARACAADVSPPPLAGLSWGRTLPWSSRRADPVEEPAGLGPPVAPLPDERAQHPGGLDIGPLVKQGAPQGKPRLV